MSDRHVGDRKKLQAATFASCQENEIGMEHLTNNLLITDNYQPFTKPDRAS